MNISACFILILILIYSGGSLFGKNTRFETNGFSHNEIADSISTDSAGVYSLPDSLPKVRIGKILLVGNNVTEADIIMREISLKENSVLDLKKLEEDVKNLYKLGLFNKIDLIPVPTDTLNKIDMMIIVEEKFFILPIPQGGFRNGQLSKFWAGMNLMWYNFRGRNETLNLNFGVFYEPFVSLSYSVPWIGKYSHYFTSVSVGYSKNYNRSLRAINDTTSNQIPDNDKNYLNKNFDASFKFGKYFSKDLSVSTTFKYNIIKTSPYEPGRTLSPDGTDDYLSLLLSSRLDTRDSYEYTLDGSFYRLEYEKIGFGQNINFNKVRMEAKNFIPVEMKKGSYITFSNKTFAALSFGGSVPVYMREFFGYNDIIRGYRNTVLEGENKLGIFSEVRIPVIDPVFLKGSSLPIVKSISALKNLNYKFGLYATVFYDLGSVWYQKDNFFKTQFRSGYGVGLNMILPFGFVGRTDFCLRQQDNYLYPSVVFDLEASF
ncbi:MAG: hypothetical protein JSS91_06375 [Bacteroidetes bacterium]|nr:hypothetical protein [Bacteroidota bacterium]